MNNLCKYFNNRNFYNYCINSKKAMITNSLMKANYRLNQLNKETISIKKEINLLNRELDNLKLEYINNNNNNKYVIQSIRSKDFKYNKD